MAYRSEYDANLALSIAPSHMPPSRQRWSPTKVQPPLVRDPFWLALAYALFIYLLEQAL